MNRELQAQVRQAVEKRCEDARLWEGRELTTEALTNLEIARQVAMLTEEISRLGKKIEEVGKCFMSAN